MAADSHNPSPTRTDLYRDLYDTLAMHRNANHAHLMAEALVRKDGSGEQLVALVDDCERAVYYSPTGRTLKGYAFGKHGVVEADFDTLWRLLSDAASWVDAHEEECSWVHPHFRWVLDAVSDDWRYSV